MAAIAKVITRLADLKLRLGEIDRSGTAFDLQPDEVGRAEVAKVLGLVGLSAFNAKIEVALWLDGAQITSTWSAVVVQTCGVSLEDFETPLAGRYTVRVTPPGSLNAPAMGGEVDLDPEADDPPDVLDGEVIDLGAYAIEHLGLEVDPFPRKPGAVFEPQQTATILSPFASLRNLKS